MRGARPLLIASTMPARVIPLVPQASRVAARLPFVANTLQDTRPLSSTERSGCMSFACTSWRRCGRRSGGLALPQFLAQPLNVIVDVIINQRIRSRHRGLEAQGDSRRRPK